ncbi:MAG: MFS transporter [Candidatus Helarchaeota archaeon]
MSLFSNISIGKKAFIEYLFSYLVIYYFFYLMISFVENNYGLDISSNLIFYGLSIIIAIIIGKSADHLKNKKIMINIATISVGTIYLFVYVFNFFTNIAIITLILFSIALGLSIAAPTFFAEITNIRERGRVQGLCVAFLYPIYFTEGILNSFDNPFLLYIFFGLSFAVPIIFLLHPSKIEKKEEVESSKFMVVYKDKQFLLYALSFFFLIISLSFIQILINNSEDIFYTALIFTICLSIMAIVGGIITDKWSRKRSILTTSIILGGSFFIFGLFLTDFSFMSMVPVIILASAGNGLDLMIEPVICADFAGPRSKGSYNSFLYLSTTSAIIFSQIIYINFISTISIISYIPQISLIVIFGVLLSIAPLIIAAESIDVSLSRNVKIMGIFLTSPDGRVLVESHFSPLKIDSTLAMSALAGVSGLISETFETKKHLKTIDYEEGKIMIEYGKYSNAILIANKETFDIRYKLKKFLSIFEKRYGKELENWTGELTKFQVAYSVIAEVFGFYK